jgi:tRNA (guanine37-N1)-methyltransferase
MHFDVVSLFPEMIWETVRHGVTGKAIAEGRVGLSVWNPRDYTHDKHKTVDDRPYGGGPGMVMKYQPLFDAVQAAQQQYPTASVKIIALSPQGQPLKQARLVQFIDYEKLILVAGRYEGIDERFINHVCDEEWSLGDYVISGGELAALVVIDALTRLLPGVLGDENSAQQDSYSDGLLDYPHFTRPEQLAIASVPRVLLSGHHAEIKRWRLQQALGRTWLRRPDLLQNKTLDAEQSQLLAEFIMNLK